MTAIRSPPGQRLCKQCMLRGERDERAGASKVVASRRRVVEPRTGFLGGRHDPDIMRPHRLSDGQDWCRDLPPGRVVVVYCVHGHEASQGAASALKAAGVDGRYLEHGIAGWAEHRLPMRSKRDTEPRSWVTRERPKIDRIACPWLIRRFIDADARVLFVDPPEVPAVARESGAIPFDIEGIEISHDGPRCHSTPCSSCSAWRTSPRSTGSP
jgi:rhodanese-related sulfurtransferase